MSLVGTRDPAKKTAQKKKIKKNTKKTNKKTKQNKQINNKRPHLRAEAASMCRNCIS
jgi:hypothetical protein